MDDFQSIRKMKERSLPSPDEFLPTVASNTECSIGDEQLPSSIASGSEPERRNLICVYDRIQGMRVQVVNLYDVLRWLSEREILGEVRERILLFTGANLVFSYWSQCGAVLNDLFHLGFNFDEYGPPINKVLTTMREKEIDRPLVDLISKAKDSVAQKKVILWRHYCIHKDALRPTGLPRIRDIRWDAGTVLIEEIPESVTSCDEMFSPHYDALFELRDFTNDFEREVKTRITAGESDVAGTI